MAIPEERTPCGLCGQSLLGLLTVLEEQEVQQKMGGQNDDGVRVQHRHKNVYRSLVSRPSVSILLHLPVRKRDRQAV